MGRARRLKEQRRWQRVLDEALKIEAQTAKKPCDSCAMVDETAWVADIGMARKILDALQGRARFYCHEGLPVVGTSYLPPLDEEGQVDARQLTPCGGFLRWALVHRQRPKTEQQRLVQALQRRMLTRWLASDDPLAQEWRENGWSAADVQMGIQMTDAHRQDDEDDPGGGCDIPPGAAMAVCPERTDVRGDREERTDVRGQGGSEARGRA